MKTVSSTNILLIRLNRHLSDAKEAQVKLVGSHGDHLSEEERKVIVDVWNALDDIGLKVHNIIQNRK